MTHPQKPSSRPPAHFLSIITLAARLDLSTKTIRRMIARGELPAHRLGRSLRVTEDDFRAFLNQSRA